MNNLTLADGTVIDASDGTVVQDDIPGYVVVPTHQEAQELVVATRRRLIDLPDLPERMNTIGIVLVYALFGLGVEDTALATGLSTMQITNIKDTDVYASLEKDTVQNILDSEAETVRGIFRQNARNAAGRIVDAMNRPGVNSFNAAKDILDRDGHRPADIVEHRHQVSGGLVIEHVRRSEDKALPVIDITAKELE